MLIVSIYKLIRAFVRKLNDDFINAFSAQAAFFLFLSFFPFAMFLLTLIQYLPIQESAVLEICTNIFPTAINSFIVTIIQELFAKAATGTLISITVIAALWSSSKGFLAIVRGMNSVYGIKETRNYVVLRLWSTLYTLVFALVILALLVTTVFGNQLYLWILNRIPILTDLALLIISVRAVVGLCLLILVFLIIYIVIPNRKSRIFAELPGAMLTAAGWMGFSYLFSYYIDNMSNYSYTYGSLTAIVLCMVWLYACMYIMFIGAEINSILSNPTIHSALKNLIGAKKKH
ncbi:MAG: YihY/virulence factor BrkB family protein [Lachnospiraceae bacterium]|nr:YihY/virulence factor BrkB family protein [Lachnospiraceae bacterium]